MSNNPFTFQVRYQGTFISRKSSEAVAQSAHEGGGVTISRNVQGLFGCGTKGLGDDGLRVGLGDFKGLFQP